MLRRLPLLCAHAMIKEKLPDREYAAISLCDVEQWDLIEVADWLNCTESNVKKIRQRGYDRLTSVLYK